jgi:hypothetical protein
MSNNNPTKEQLRTARHLGAKAALSHLPEDKRNNLLAVHGKLDERRERNISDFKSKARGETPAG